MSRILYTGLSFSLEVENIKDKVNTKETRLKHWMCSQFYVWTEYFHVVLVSLLLTCSEWSFHSWLWTCTPLLKWHMLALSFFNAISVLSGHFLSSWYKLKIRKVRHYRYVFFEGTVISIPRLNFGLAVQINWLVSILGQYRLIMG